jgi:hypothetical protein
VRSSSGSLATAPAPRPSTSSSPQVTIQTSADHQTDPPNHPAALTVVFSAITTATSSGIEFHSRHGDNLTLWALFERDTASGAPPQITPIDAQPIDDQDPELAEAMRLHRLT